jgi:hypothetical protein
MKSNFFKTPMRLVMGFTILVIAFALVNFIPDNSVNAARDCRVDATATVSTGGGGCKASDETCIKDYCSQLNFLRLQGFFDNKMIDENKQEQNEANKGDINNPEQDCLSSTSSSMRMMCGTSSSYLYYY